MAASNSVMKNSYLEQVMQETEQVQEDLRSRKKRAVAERRAVAAPQALAAVVAPEPAGSSSVDVRITGFWRWKNVIVPPNAHVVHTRRGREDPVTLGLGKSFRYNPVTDTFLVVPAAMQTIIIRANCICRERQGVVVQGYVQWIIDDFATAYRKLDFTDAYDPMRVVNVQLREQAEAAIKDKVATMSIDDVLADKQPIIEELTSRLRAVAEGDGDIESGLGLRIVTVQIKEAIVSSPKVWEMLQRPFRAERDKEARLAQLESQAIVRGREAQEEKRRVKAQIDVERESTALRAALEAENFDREQTERVRRAEIEAETLERTMAHEKNSVERQAELDMAKAKARIDVAELEALAEHSRELRQVDLQRAQRTVENDRSPEAVRMALIESLPQIADALPKAEALQSISIGDNALGALASSVSNAISRRPSS